MIVTVKSLSCKLYTIPLSYIHVLLQSKLLKNCPPPTPIITHLTFGIPVDAFVPFVTVHLSLFLILPLSQVIFRLLLNNG